MKFLTSLLPMFNTFDDDTSGLALAAIKGAAIGILVAIIICCVVAYFMWPCMLPSGI